MGDSKKRKVHTPEFKAKVGLERKLVLRRAFSSRNASMLATGSCVMRI